MIFWVERYMDSATALRLRRMTVIGNDVVAKCLCFFRIHLHVTVFFRHKAFTVAGS